MKYLFVDRRIPRDALLKLTELGFSPTLIDPPEALLGSAVESHTDLVLFCHGSTAVASKKYLSQNPDIKDAIYTAFPTVIESTCEAGAAYPFDAAYNALVVGSTLFAKTDTVCPDILRYCEQNGLGIRHTRQGYPACLTLKVGERAAVTSDRGLYRALTDSGIDTLLIGDSEKIALRPYPFGFIGGTAGTYGKNIYFVGDLDAHPEGDRIKDFVESYGFSAVSLMPGCGCLFDVGGIVFSL